MNQKPFALSRAPLILVPLLLSICMVAAAQVAVDEVGEVDELEELDEIWVLGKITANRVTATENRVFRLYNRLNKDNQYDVHCGDMRLSPDSMVMGRTCLPNFISTKVGNPVPLGSAPIAFAGSGYRSQSSCPGIVDLFNSMDSWDYGGPCSGVDPYYSPPSFSYSSYYRATTTVPKATPEERAAYTANVLRVIQSDQKLLEMARGLARMYGEMDRIRARYLKVRADRLAAQVATRAEKGTSKARWRSAPR